MRKFTKATFSNALTLGAMAHMSTKMAGCVENWQMERVGALDFKLT